MFLQLMRIDVKTHWVLLGALMFWSAGSEGFAEADALSAPHSVQGIVLDEATLEVASVPFKGESVTIQVASRLEAETAALLKAAIDEGEKILDQMEEWNRNQNNKASIQLTDAIERFFDRLETLRHVDSNAWLRLFQRYAHSSASEALSALDKNSRSLGVLPASN